MESEDTEITLGLGKLLGLFLLLAAICGVFFAIGYSVGRSAAREEALANPSSQGDTSTVQAATSAPVTNDKPSAAIAGKARAVVPSGEKTDQDKPKSNLTFYDAVKQSGGKPQGATNDATNGSSGKPQVVEASASVPEGATAKQGSSQPSPLYGTVQHGAAGSPSAAQAGPVPVTGAGTIVVQIAAVSREDDAVALAGALRKKDYSVFVVNNPATHDKLYHVQVGPFSSTKDAEAMKARLVAEGYSPIIKR